MLEKVVTELVETVVWAEGQDRRALVRRSMFVFVEVKTRVNSCLARIVDICTS